MKKLLVLLTLCLIVGCHNDVLGPYNPPDGPENIDVPDLPNHIEVIISEHPDVPYGGYVVFEGELFFNGYPGTIEVAGAAGCEGVAIWEGYEFIPHSPSYFTANIDAEFESCGYHIIIKIDDIIVFEEIQLVGHYANIQTPLEVWY